MSNLGVAHRRVTWLMLGGAFVLSAPSCGGRAGENSASGGEASTMGSSSDEDGDGVLDSLGKTVDRDKDGKPDQIDVDGDGQDDGVAVDTDGDGKPDGAGLDTDGDGIIDAIDVDGDGKPDDVGSTSGDGDGDGDTGSGGDAGDGDSGSGGDATSTGDGDGDTGSGGNAGDGDGDASGGTGGDDGPNPGVQTLGETCGSPGGLACAGERQKLQLLCDGSGKWVQNGTCAGTAVCDTGEDNRGSCQEPLPECLGNDSSHRYCADHVVKACGPDGLGSDFSVVCDYSCTDGACSSYTACTHPDILLNCDEECGAISQDCTKTPSGCYSATLRSTLFPGLIRLPNAADMCPSPLDGCDDRTIGIVVPSAELGVVSVMVPDGWSMSVLRTSDDLKLICDAQIRQTGCVELKAGGGYWLVFIADSEESLSVNVPIVESDTYCPT